MGKTGEKGNIGKAVIYNDGVINFGAANLGNIPSDQDRSAERDEGLMFPGFYDGLFNVYHKINNSFWTADQYLSSGFCLANTKNITNLNNPIFNDRLIPCIKLPFKKKGFINCISYNSPNILKKKRPTISIAIVKVLMDRTSGPIITYYGSTGEENCISAAPLVTDNIEARIIPVVKESSSPVNQLFLVDLNKNQCGRIKVNNILVEKNEAIGIFVRVNTIIRGITESKIGKVDEEDTKYIDCVRPINMTIHVQEVV
jgi:hypothetical protein